MEMILRGEQTKKNIYLENYNSVTIEDMNCNRQITLLKPNHRDDSVSVD
jgi:D-hexose-6-phosphate mutarotase